MTAPEPPRPGELLRFGEPTWGAPRHRRQPVPRPVQVAGPNEAETTVARLIERRADLPRTTTTTDDEPSASAVARLLERRAVAPHPAKPDGPGDPSDDTVARLLHRRSRPDEGDHS